MQNLLKTAKLKIQKIYKDYSFDDICYSLFIISSWLPNVSSQVKCLFLYLSLLEIYDFKFTEINKIKTYEDFKNFYRKIRTFIPSFPLLEDYVPEQDWGDLFYYYDNKFNKYLYGGEIENTYDHLKFFELYHVSLYEEFNKIIGQKSTNDLKNILNLQDYIIDNLKNNISKDIKTGYLECPNEKFWNDCCSFLYTKLNILDFFETKILDLYSEQTAISEQILQDNNFGQIVSQGNVFNSLFIKRNNKYYLLPIRRMITVLLDKWNKIITENINLLSNESNNKILKKKLFGYVYSKIPQDSYYFTNISLITELNSEPFSIDAFLIHKNRIVMFFLQELNNELIEDSESYLVNLSKKIPLLKEKLIQNNCLQFIYEGKLVELKSDFDNIYIDTVVIHPSLTTSLSYLGFHEGLNFQLFIYTDFIQFIDEIENIEDFFKKIDYLKNTPQKSFSSNADYLSFYTSENEGEILTGYKEYSNLILDPFYSDQNRYENLKKFWLTIPKNTINNIPPENWIYEKMENSNSLYMYSKHYRTMAIYCNINNSDIFINSLPLISHKYGDAIKIFIEMIEDSFKRYEEILSKHFFFKNNNKLQILVVPTEMIKEKQINYLYRFLNFEGIWQIKLSKFIDCNGLQIIFDKEILYKTLMEVNDQSLQVDLFTDIINNLNCYCNDNDLTKKLLQKLNCDKTKPTRFKVYSTIKDTCYPVYHENMYPRQKDFIKVQNIMAKILHEANILPGVYDLDKAKYILDILKKKLVQYLNIEVKKYNFNKSLPLILTYNDANINNFVMKEKKLEISLEHEVDYSREKELADAKTKYIRESNNYRYLIEKFVQLQPGGNKNLDEESLCFLLALVDWLIIAYRHSDSIHYNLFAYGLIVKEDKSIETIFKEDISEKEDLYEKIDAEEQLYKNYPHITFTPYMNYHEEFCLKFKEDFGFNFQNMINVLTVLSKWIEDNHTYIIADKNEIIENTKKLLKDYTTEEEKEIPFILDFLTLESYNITKILDKKDFSKTIQCDDIPLDEFNLRFCRYTIKPLIKYKDKYIWGPYSAQATGKTFCTHLCHTRLPYNLRNSKSQRLLEKIKNIHEKELVKNTFDIIKKYTKFADKEVEFHKRDKNNTHPKELGDYDVLAFIPECNILLNIECKHHLVPFSPKDARKYLDKMYEPDKTGKSAIDRVINREKYLSENYQTALKILNVQPYVKPKIISLYVTKIRTFQIMFPREKTNIKLLSVYDLEDYLNSILTTSVMN